MNKKSPKLLLCHLLAIMLLAGSVTAFNACSGDDDEAIIDYYLNISSKEPIGTSTADEEQGTMGQPRGTVLSNTIYKMRMAVHDNYPVANTQGNDIEIAAACDNIYGTYKSLYGPFEKNTICVIKLYRVKKIDGVIRGSRAMRTYRFGAIPPEQE